MSKKLDLCEELKGFFDSSKTFRGIVMSGLYDLPEDIFFTALEKYLATGKNYLDEYSEIRYFYWKRTNYESNISLYNRLQSKFKIKSKAWKQYEELKEECKPNYSKKEIKRIEKLLNNKGFWNIKYSYTDEEIESTLKFLEFCKEISNGNGK